ncbi:MAG: transposase [bacterium]
MSNQHSNDAKPQGWHSRGFLPHFDGLLTTQSLTIRLADSMPRSVVNGWIEELSYLPDIESRTEMQIRIDRYLDSGYGGCALQQPQIAQMVENALFFFDGKRYYLHAWVLMPNHAHVLLTPFTDYSLSNIVFSIKSYTANQANLMLNQHGKFWYSDYYDRFIRDEEHYKTVAYYIEQNPVKAGLCSSSEQWPWSSARFNKP